MKSHNSLFYLKSVYACQDFNTLLLEFKIRLENAKLNVKKILKIYGKMVVLSVIAKILRNGIRMHLSATLFNKDYKDGSLL